MHRGFVAAGSDIILTNSFGGTRQRLKLHQAQDRVAELNGAAARLARGVADAAGRPVLVAGSMGPTGELVVPLGAMTMDEATAAFAEQAQALAAGGVDLLWIETMSSAEEVEAAVAGAATTDLPVVVTLSFDTNGRTMMGITPEAAVALFQRLPRRPVGVRRQLRHRPGPAAGDRARPRTAPRTPDALIVAKGNCGIPEYRDGQICYSGTPEIMATYARLARDCGARIIGGCCGTTAVHVAAMRRALDHGPHGRHPDHPGDRGGSRAGGRAEHRAPPRARPGRAPPPPRLTERGSGAWQQSGRGPVRPALPRPAALRSGVAPRCLDIDGVERLARGHEQPVALAAAEADVGADLRQPDLADARAVGREDVHAVVTVADPAGRRPDVAVLVDADAVGEAALLAVHLRSRRRCRPLPSFSPSTGNPRSSTRQRSE